MPMYVMTEHTIKVMSSKSFEKHENMIIWIFPKDLKLFIQRICGSAEEWQQATCIRESMTNRYTPEMETQEKIPEKKPEKKAPADRAKTEAEEIGSEPPKKPTQEVKKKPEERIPGQTEITKDFPEYCPDNMEVPAEITEEKEIKRAYATRRLCRWHQSQRRKQQRIWRKLWIRKCVPCEA